MNIQDYFLQYTRELAYLELKKERSKQEWVQNLQLDSLPLPIIVSDFTEGIRTGQFAEELNFKYFVRGMIWNLGIDPDFKYAEAYKEILKKTVKEAWRFAVQMGLDALKSEQAHLLTEEADAEEDSASLQQKERENLVHALIAFRAASLLAPDQAQALTSYGRFLWQVDAGRDSEAFVKKASAILEQAIQLDPSYAQAYVALADLNTHLGNYLKAQAYYEHGLAVSEEEREKEEIRARMESIADEAAIEDGIYYIRRADYDRAIEALMEAKKNSKRYDADYYLGICYEQVGNFEAAAEAFLSAVEKGGSFGSLYNDLVYSLNALGRQEEALVYAKKGLEEEPSNIRLRYNRAVIETALGSYEQAIEDCNFLLEYADLSDDMVDLCMQLKEQIDRRQKTQP